LKQLPGVAGAAREHHSDILWEPGSSFLANMLVLGNDQDRVYETLRSVTHRRDQGVPLGEAFSRTC
jgi:hypothetical protein